MAGAVLVALAWEAALCVVIGFPIFLLMASIGGFCTALLYRTERPASQHGTLLVLFLLAPYLVTPLERQVPVPDSGRTVRNSILIRADVGTVWEHIIRVRAIRNEEQRFSFLHLIGIPRPIEATLSNGGIGAVRYATFRGGLTFVETVTEWQDGRAIGFGIRRDRDSPPPAPLNGIGGPYFDVLEGRYEIEPIDDRTVMLHLASTHRLSTRFNWYAGLWTDWIMGELQQYILRIIRARAEARYAAPLGRGNAAQSRAERGRRDPAHRRADPRDGRAVACV